MLRQPRNVARIAALVFGLMSALMVFSAPRPSYAQEKGKLLTVGPVPLFLIRNGDTLNGKQMSVEDRVNRVQEVFAKYLGGPQGTITSKPVGDRVHLYLNGEFVLAVTPADAKATAHKTTASLAPIWQKELQRGFNGAHTHVSGSSQR